MNKKIAELILRAQVASDGGKGIIHSTSRKARRDNAGGYSRKDEYILEAIRLILTTGNEFKFSVVEDKEDKADFIVYFTTKVDGEKFQVSFHSFCGELAKYCHKSFRIPWDHWDSRESAEIIYRHFVPEGRYI